MTLSNNLSTYFLTKRTATCCSTIVWEVKNRFLISNLWAVNLALRQLSGNIPIGLWALHVIVACKMDYRCLRDITPREYRALEQCFDFMVGNGLASTPVVVTVFLYLLSWPHHSIRIRTTEHRFKWDRNILGFGIREMYDIYYECLYYWSSVSFYAVFR